MFIIKNVMNILCYKYEKIKNILNNLNNYIYKYESFK